MGRFHVVYALSVAVGRVDFKQNGQALAEVLVILYKQLYKALLPAAARGASPVRRSLWRPCTSPSALSLLLLSVYPIAVYFICRYSYGPLPTARTVLHGSAKSSEATCYVGGPGARASGATALQEPSTRRRVGFGYLPYYLHMIRPYLQLHMLSANLAYTHARVRAGRCCHRPAST